MGVQDLHCTDILLHIDCLSDDCWHRSMSLCINRRWHHHHRCCVGHSRFRSDRLDVFCTIRILLHWKVQVLDEEAARHTSYSLWMRLTHWSQRGDLALNWYTHWSSLRCICWHELQYRRHGDVNVRWFRWQLFAKFKKVKFGYPNFKFSSFNIRFVKMRLFAVGWPNVPVESEVNGADEIGAKTTCQWSSTGNQHQCEGCVYEINEKTPGDG